VDGWIRKEVFGEVAWTKGGKQTRKMTDLAEKEKEQSKTPTETPMVYPVLQVIPHYQEKFR
jgi:hypothetical protein